MSEPATFTGAELIVALLERLGTTTVAGIPGGAVLPLYDALARSARIRHALARHEQGAGFIAQGMARASGRPGVCIASSGPGATNLSTAVADAKLDSIPLVAVTGQVPQALIGTDAFQEVDTFGLALPIAKRNYLVTKASDLPRIVPEVIAARHDDAAFEALGATPDGGSGEDCDRYAAERELPFWQLDLSFSGPEALVELRWAHALDRFRAIADVRFANAPTYRFPPSAEKRAEVRDKTLLGIPSLEGFTGRRSSESEVADGHVDFSVVVPMTGAAVLCALKVLNRVFAESGVDVGMRALTSFRSRTLTFISSFPTMRENRAANTRVREVYRLALEVATAEGWGQYRAHAAFMDEALAAYSFNDHALARLHSAPLAARGSSKPPAGTSAASVNVTFGRRTASTSAAQVVAARAGAAAAAPATARPQRSEPVGSHGWLINAAARSGSCCGWPRSSNGRPRGAAPSKSACAGRRRRCGRGCRSGRRRARCRGRQNAANRRLSSGDRPCSVAWRTYP